MATLATTPSRNVRARTREVVAYDRDTSKPGKPLHLLIPGGLLALGAFVGILLTSYSTYVAETIPSSQGWTGVGLLLLPYFGGLLLFSYGYELYNWPRAIRLTLIAGAIGLAIILVCFTIVYVWRLLAAGAAGAGGAKSLASDADSDSGGSGFRGGSGSGSKGSSPLVDLRGAVINLGSAASSEGQPLSLAVCPKCGSKLRGGIGSVCPRCEPTSA